MRKLLLIISALFLFSCNKEDNAVEKTITNGTWVIYSYIDSGVDETYHFTGYTFNFNDDGSVLAKLNSNGVYGNWFRSSDDSHEELNIVFNQAPLNEINNDWKVIVISESTIELQDVSGGDGETDYLKFNKN
jgi:hypothetical protein